MWRKRDVFIPRAPQRLLPRLPGSISPVTQLCTFLPPAAVLQTLCCVGLPPSAPHIWQSSWGAERSSLLLPASVPSAVPVLPWRYMEPIPTSLAAGSCVGSTVLFLTPHRSVRESSRAGAAPLAPHSSVKPLLLPPPPMVSANPSRPKRRLQSPQQSRSPSKSHQDFKG